MCYNIQDNGEIHIFSLISGGKAFLMAVKKSSTNAKKKRKPKKARTAKQIKRRSIIFTAFWCCFLIAAIVGLTVVGYIVHDVVSVVNGDKVIDLNVYKENQDQTTIIYAYDDDKKLIELKSLHGAENRIWVDIDKIPQDFQDAFICLEDKRFLSHHGVDWYRVASILTKGGSQGGSTITQQLIKNLTQENKRTFVRKYREIEYALNLEKYYDKNEILEAYMNTIYLSHGCYGVQTASEYYFGKDVSELTLAECACLAAITQYPSANDPTIHPEDNYYRAKVCIYAMLDQGCITQEEYDEAHDQLEKGLTFTEGKKKVSSKEKDEDVEEKETVNSYYIDYVIDSVIDDLIEKYDYTYQQANNKLYSGGLRIYAAIDMKVQEQMEEIYVNRIGFANDEVQSSMTIMDYEGRVCGIMGGAGEKTENRSLNRAADSPRQPGSSIKPLSVYSVAIENNEVTWSTMLPNYGIMTLDGMIWPRNQGGWVGGPDDLIPVQKGIARSLNTISAQTLKRVGVHTSFEWLVNNMHISTAVTEGEYSDEGYSQLATGSMSYGITTLEMAAAYATFGNGGVYYKPYCYYKVTDSTGKTILLQHDDKGEQVMSGDTAEIMCKLLQTVTTDPSGTGGAYSVAGFPTMAKTGTTTDSFDRWFAGGTPYYVAAVWYGYDKNREVTDSGNPAGKIFREIMNPLHENLDRSKTFVTSNTVVQRAYCLATGNLATDSCANTAMGWYSASHLPKTCDGKNEEDEEDESTSTTKKGEKTTKKNEKTTAKTTEKTTEKTTAEKTTVPTTEKTTVETTTESTTESTTRDPNIIDEWEDDE